MKKFYLIFLWLCAVVQAQITINVIAIPDDTPVGDSIYIVGNFNNWIPGDVHYLLKKHDGIWKTTIPEGEGILEYKFTRGNWTMVEGGEDGKSIENRNFSFTGAPQSIEVSILSWSDLEGIEPQSTAAWNVKVMHPNFYMPQLDRNRKIWIYLPPDYNTSNKSYPVIYMHDGQNLFDELTAFSGEWKVDETLNDLFNAGDYGAIVIGVENGQEERLNEYSPWKNSEYGGGDGDLYSQFMETSLKPYVDANYRTKPEAKYTAIIGSSMGGLISTYIGLSTSSFGRIGAMSPSYWFAHDALLKNISDSSRDYSQTRVYFMGSSNESSTLSHHIETIRKAWQLKGLTKCNSRVKIDEYGGHNEAYWSGEFKSVYQWLFKNELKFSEKN